MRETAALIILLLFVGCLGGTDSSSFDNLYECPSGEFVSDIGLCPEEVPRASVYGGGGVIPTTTPPPGTPIPPTITLPPTTAPPITTPPPSYPEGKIKVGAFNIQVFGQTKAGRGWLMEHLANIARNFDILAVQEIRDSAETTMPIYLDYINAFDGPNYDFVIGPRLGRTSSKEQYAYLYNTETIEPIGNPTTYPEPFGDIFHREPYISTFKAKNGSFDFVLITIHTDPDEATEEISALPDVVRYALSEHPAEEDIIILGDLNADCANFKAFSTSPLRTDEYIWLIDDETDTTAGLSNCAYDRIIITEPSLNDFTGEAGVYRYDLEYQLNYDRSNEISDHYPIYAEFWTHKDID